MPKISVCIDVCNYAEYLPQAVESVLAQTLQDFELIIVDDCSSDDSFAIAERYAGRDSRIIARRNAVNLGMIGNRNAALSLARGDYVKFVHADDFLCSSAALEKMAAALDAWAALSLVACATCSVDATGRETGVSRHLHANRIVSGTSIITRCIVEQRNLIGGPSAVMFRRDRAARGFDEEFFHAADLEMWFHLLEQGAFQWLNEPLCAYRWHAAQQTEKDRRTDAAERDYVALLDRYLDRLYVDAKPWLKRLLHASAEARLRGDKALASKAAGWTAKWFRARSRRDSSRRIDDKLPLGVNVAGFLGGEYGIGSSSRAWAMATRDTGLQCAFLNVRSKVHSNSDATFGDFSSENPYRVNLMTFSADYARRFYRDKGRRFFAGRRNIAVWFWEVEQFPARWHSAFDWHDEIWTATRFCEESLRAVSPIPVYRIPYPYHGRSAVPTRPAFGIAPDEFAFLFNFDFLSVVERKNPHALIEAFRRAFSPTEKVLLVMKTINSAKAPAEAAKIQRAIEGLRVRWIEPHLPGGEMNSLFASCDCYASLHRSEGLGLGMIQAMWLGKPVIGTGWSGNLDFMNEGNSRLVRYTLTDLDRDYGPYERGNRWAEADVEHAAELMRWMFDNREAAKALGAKAAASIRETLSPSATSALIRERLAS